MNQELHDTIHEVAQIARPQKCLATRLRVSMQSTYKHPNLKTDYEQFVAAIAATFISSNSSDKEIIKTNIDTMHKISAFIQCCNQGTMNEFPIIPLPKKALKLISLWVQIKGELNVTTQQRAKKLN